VCSFPKTSVPYPFPCHILVILLPSFNPCCRWARCWHLRPTNHGACDANGTRSLLAVLALSCTLASFTKLRQGPRWPRLLRCHHAQGLLAARHYGNGRWAMGSSSDGHIGERRLYIDRRPEAERNKDDELGGGLSKFHSVYRTNRPIY
jgi:hypothetical protein